MEERYHATKQNRFYPGMSHVNKILQWRQNLSAHLHIKTTFTNVFHFSYLNFYRQKYTYSVKCLKCVCALKVYKTLNRQYVSVASKKFVFYFIGHIILFIKIFLYLICFIYLYILGILYFQHHIRIFACESIDLKPEVQL